MSGLDILGVNTKTIRNVSVFDTVEEVLLVGSLVIYGSIIVYNVVARQVPSITPIDAWLQIVLLFVSWYSWIGFSFATRKNVHLRFNLVREELSRRVVYVLYLIEWSLYVLFFGAILWFSVPYMQNMIELEQKVQGTEIPLYIAFLSVPVGILLALYRVAQRAYEVTRKYRNGEDIISSGELMGE